MNTLDDDLRTVLRRQADAMQVPTRIEDWPLARVTPLAPVVARRWLLPAAAVVLLVVGGLALAQRRSPGTASTAVPDDSIAVTTTGVITLVPSQTVDARDEAWRAAVYEEMASFGTCAIADRTAGSDVLFVSRVTCNHFSDGKPVDGNLVFDLSKLPANVDTNLAGWQQGVAGFDTPGEQVGGNAEMFVETSGGTVRRVAIVTPTHLIRITPELVESEYLPSGDALAVAAQHLSLLADSILAKQ